MKTIPSRALVARPGRVWEELDREGAIVITKDGVPRSIMIPTSDRTLLEDAQEVVFARARKAVRACPLNRSQAFKRLLALGACAVCVVAFSVVSAQPAPDPTVMVFDLNGDGLSFTTVEQGVSFDIDGNGVPRQTAWTLKGSDDSFLVVDNNKNGKIDSAGEVVGNRLILENGARARTGTDVLQFHLQGYAVGPDGRRVDPSTIDLAGRWPASPSRLIGRGHSAAAGYQRRVERIARW